MARSITFTVDGPVDTLIKIEELSDGTLKFDIQVLGSALLGDLRGIFFDLADVDASTAGLSAVGIDGSEDVIGDMVFSEEGSDRVEKDVNVKAKLSMNRASSTRGSSLAHRVSAKTTSRPPASSFRPI